MAAVSGTKTPLTFFRLYPAWWQIRQSMFASWACEAVASGKAPRPVWQFPQLDQLPRMFIQYALKAVYNFPWTLGPFVMY
jgi:hypothetical protein